MVAYFLQVTAIWTVLLLVYELLYARSGRYTANRVYLLFSLLIGLIFPLLPAPWKSISLGSLGAEAITLQPTTEGIQVQGGQPAQQVASGVASASLSIDQIVIWAYLSVALALLTWSLLQAGRIVSKIVRRKYILIHSYRVYENERPHPPFSFMGRVFIYHPHQYEDGQLKFILRHEHAHSRRYHWLDLLLIQFFCIACWFHPLVWRYRYLLKMQHEFEADNLAAREQYYEYGTFLLQQTLMKGLPAIVHSFHYSPIKNRITMLTRKSKSNRWKYIAVLPVLAACTMAMGSGETDLSRRKEGDITTFKGSTFRWAGMGVIQSDTIIVEDPFSGEKLMQVMQRETPPYIVEMDGQAVAMPYGGTEPLINDRKTELASFGDYLKTKIAANVPDSIAQVRIENVVVDKKGKIRYYDVTYASENSMFSSSNKALDQAVDAAITNIPRSKFTTPGESNVFYQTIGTAFIKNTSMQFRGELVNPVTPVSK